MSLSFSESFKWLASDVTSEDYGKDSVRIKFVAMRANEVSKNLKKYVFNELMKSARTLRLKPININHDPKRIVGHVDWAEFDETDGKLEGVGIVKKEPALSLLRKKDPSVKGVSIEGDYRYLKCTHKGCENREPFYSEESFRKHLHDAHQVHDDIKEVGGLFLNGLAVVLSPEVPGGETSLELMETAQGYMKVIETMSHDIEEKLKMKEKTENRAFALQNDPAMLGKTVLRANPAGPEPPTPEPQKIVKEEKKPESPKVIHDEIILEVGKRVEPVKPKESLELSACEPDYGKLKETKLKPFKLGETIPKMTLGEPFAGYTDFADCVAKNKDKDNPEAYCGSIKHEVEGETYFKNKVTEFLIGMGEAFTIHEGSLKTVYEDLCKRIGGLPKDDTSWKEAIEGWKDDTSWKQMFESLPKDDTSWKEHIDNHPPDDLGWKDIKPFDSTALNEAIKLVESKIPDITPLDKRLDTNINCQRTVSETIAKRLDELKIPDIAPLEKKLAELQIPDIAPLEKKLNEIKIPQPYDDTPIKEMMSKIFDVAPIKEMSEDDLLKKIIAVDSELNNLYPKDQVKPTANVEDQKTQQERWIKQEVLRREKEQLIIALVNRKVQKSLEAIETLKEAITQQKKDFETILATADKNIGEVTKSVEEWRKKAEEFEAKLKEKEEKTTQETLDMEKKVEEVRVKVDNVEDKMKGKFKGKTADATKQEGTPSYNRDPYVKE